MLKVYCGPQNSWISETFSIERLFRGVGKIEQIQCNLEDVPEDCLLVVNDIGDLLEKCSDIVKLVNPVAIFAGQSEPLQASLVCTFVEEILKVKNSKDIKVFVDPTSTDTIGQERIQQLCFEQKIFLTTLEGFRNFRWGLEDPELGDLQGSTAEQICTHYIQEAQQEKPLKFLCKTRRWDPQRILLFYKIVSSVARLSRFELTANVGFSGSRYFGNPVTATYSMCKTLAKSEGLEYNYLVDLVDRPWYGFWNQSENGGGFIHENAMFSVRKYFYLELVAENSRFQTEKVFKPMLWGIPCFYFGPKGMIKQLHKQGFKTFDWWWDESYDELEYADPQKLELILREIDRLSARGSADLIHMYGEMVPTLLHNARQLDLIPESVKTTYRFLENLVK